MLQVGIRKYSKTENQIRCKGNRRKYDAQDQEIAQSKKRKYQTNNINHGSSQACTYTKMEEIHIIDTQDTI